MSSHCSWGKFTVLGMPTWILPVWVPPCFSASVHISSLPLTHKDSSVLEILLDTNCIVFSLNPYTWSILVIVGYSAIMSFLAKASSPSLQVLAKPSFYLSFLTASSNRVSVMMTMFYIFITSIYTIGGQ